MTDATKPGMVVFQVRSIESREVYEYECLDSGCARLLAAGDHGGDPEDYEIVDD